MTARYAGRSTPRTLLLLPDGRVLSERALAKLRALDAGHAYVEEVLRSFGAPPRAGADPATWVPRALRAAGVRTLRHPGNYRYLFRLGDRRAKRSVRVGFPSLPYPKQVDNDLVSTGVDVTFIAGLADRAVPGTRSGHHRGIDLEASSQRSCFRERECGCVPVS